ncbi:transposase [Pectinatus frisingensis]|uniref:transposase n=1 Tax=Pectinatus frisingensis TaxID=865 RepID=UPI003D800590
MVKFYIAHEKFNSNYFKTNQIILPLFVSDYLDICDPVLVFDRFMEEIDLEKYLRNIPSHLTTHIRYNPTSILKTILFGFMTNGYISLLELEDCCKVNLRFMYLMDHEAPSYLTFGYFIENMLKSSVEELFSDIDKKIFTKNHVDLSHLYHLYIDGSKFEANANKCSSVWKKATEKSRYRLFKKLTGLLNKINDDLASFGIKIDTNSEYVPKYLDEVTDRYAKIYENMKQNSPWKRPSKKHLGDTITSVFKNI